jgi:hypothetical protein
MRRSQLEHIIRAAGSIAGDDEIVVIGSSSVLAQYPDIPGFMLHAVVFRRLDLGSKKCLL